MKKSIITAEVFSKRNPFIAVFASLFLPGLGHAYCSEWARGFFFAAAISLLAIFIPFGLIIHPDQPSLRHAILMAILCIIAYFTCHIDAVHISLKKNKIGSASPVRPYRFIAFALLSSLMISASLLVIPAFYSLKNMSDEAMQPSFFVNEKLLLASISAVMLQPGDAVAFQINGLTRIGRIIAKGNDRINSKDGMMEVNGMPLSIGIVLAEEIASRDLIVKEDLFYEVSGNKKYPLHIMPVGGRIRFTGTPALVPTGHFAIAFDNRLHEKLPLVIRADSIIGRVEGVLAGKTWKRFFLPPYDTN